ncbi:MAG TPA: glycosyltransferase family 9 protein [Acidimicrobiales bacterium]|nr:glycosyltransferase family 9 protein [Acidimicrobiales bacterium]
MTSRRPLLVALRALKLGDLLTGLPALRALRRAFPEHRCVLLAPGWLSHLAMYAGAADEVMPHPGLVAIPRCLHGADVAVDLHGRGPGSQPLLLEARPAQLLCFAHPEVPGTEHGARWLPVEHETARWCRMLSHYGIHADPGDLDIKLPPMRPGTPAAFRAGLEYATIVHPGAASRSRRWPPERFAAVARSELEKGRPVLVSAGPGEISLAHQVVAGATTTQERTGTQERTVLGSPCTGGAPRIEVLNCTSLLDLAAVLGRCGRLVSGDTGVSHLATALRVPSVVLCGPVGPHLWGPPAARPWHISLWTGRDGDPRAAELDPGLAEITVDQVLDALAALDALSHPGASHAFNISIAGAAFVQRTAP